MAEPEYRFKHALIQEAAYRTLVTADRNHLHREAAGG
jgi:predicted ATPase